MRGSTIVALSLLTLLFTAQLGWPQPHEHKEHAGLAKAMKDAKIPLQQAVTASAKDGEWKTVTEKLD